MSPKVTIIVPTYNRYELLKKCMKSLLEQTYNNIEIIVINNGSQDNSSEYLNNLKEKDNRIKLIEFEKNTGSPYACYNAGIKEATGEYITFMYDDDMLVPDAVESILNLDEQDVILAPCIDEDSKELTVKSFGNVSKSITIKDMLNSNQGHGEESINFVKSDILKNYIFDEKAYGGEGLIWIEIINEHGAYYLHKGLRIYKKNEAHEQFTGYENYFKNIERIIYSSEKYLELYKKINVYDIAKTRYCKQVILLIFLYLYSGDRKKLFIVLEDLKSFKLKVFMPFIILVGFLPNVLTKRLLINMNKLRILLRERKR